MSKLQDCAEIIKNIMMYNSDDVRLAENKLNTAFETMLVFLDHQDLIDIVRGRVLPYLRPKQSALFYDYITQNLAYWKECYDSTLCE